MGMTLTQMLIRAHCGDLTWMCCLSADQMVELQQLTDGMSETELRTLYKLVCGCAPGGPITGGNGGGLSSQTCIKQALTAICTTPNRAVITGAIIVLGTVTSIPTLPASAVAVLLALLAALKALDAACSSQDLAEGAAQAICDAFASYDNAFNSLPATVKPLLVGLDKGSVLDGLMTKFRACCAAGGSPAGGTPATPPSGTPVSLPGPVPPATVPATPPPLSLGGARLPPLTLAHVASTNRRKG